LSSTEQAVVDAGNLTSDDMSTFRPDQDGDIGASSNKIFVNRFLEKMSPEERSGYLTEDGRANKQLIDRIQVAIFQKAYNSTDLLKLTAEEADPDIKNILNGLNAAAGSFAKARGLDENLAGIDVVDVLVSGIEFLRTARAENPEINSSNGKSKILNQVNQSLSQGDIFGSQINQSVQDIAVVLATNIKSGKRIGEFIDNIGVRLKTYIADLSQQEMFGTKESISTSHLILYSKEKLEAKYEEKQRDLFGMEPVPGPEKEGKPSNFGRGFQSSKPATDGRTETGKTGEGKPEEVTPSSKTKIEDFGEKIGGAKKDYATSLTDAKKLDTASNTLEKTFPEPKYQSLIDGGANPEIISMVRALRDEIPLKPRNHFKLKRWAGMVETLRGIAETLLSGTVSIATVKEEMKNPRGNLGSTLEKADLYMTFGHKKSLKDIKIEKVHWSLYRGQKDVTKWQITKKTGGKASWTSNMPRLLGEGATRQEAIDEFKKNHYDMEDSTGGPRETNFDIYNYKADPKVIWVGKKVGSSYIDLKSFESPKEAKEYIRANHDSLVEELKKHKYIPDVRRKTNEERIGEDHRNGKDVTPEKFLETFGFRGVEFGNWVSKTGERQNSLNNAFDALTDLAGVLGIPTRAISLNGELGLAFGARGSGGKFSHAAHYEPGKVVINLTKNKGAGSLAHEWWHALDNYFSRMREEPQSYLSERPYKKAIDPSKEIRQEMIDAFREIKDAYNATEIRKRSEKLDTKRPKPYWGTDVEITARIFESYIISELAEKGYSNDFLANIISKDEFTKDLLGHLGGTDSQAADYYPYLTDKEGVDVNKAIADFFKTIKTEKTDKGEALYSTLPDTNQSPQPVTLSQIKKWFPGQSVGLNPDGSTWVRLQNGAGLIIRNVEQVAEGRFLVSTESGKMDQNGIIAGKYSNNEIELVDGVADGKTLSHELEHFLENIGVITTADMFAMDARINSLAKKGEFKKLKDQRENRANFLAQYLADREAYRGTIIGRVLQKVADFLDGVLHLGRASVRKVARGIESGEIFSREARESQSGESQFQTADITTFEETRTPISRQDYLDNQAETNNLKAAAEINLSRFWSEIKQGTDRYLGSISTRLGNISESIKNKVRKLDYDIGKNLTADTLAVKPLLVKAKKNMTGNDFKDWDYARKNSDIPKINELIEKYNLRKEYDNFRAIIDKTRKEAIDVGMEVGEIEEYSPRVLKDPEGFLKAMGKDPQFPIFTRRINARAQELGISPSELTKDQRADMISSMLLGGNAGLSGVSFTKDRKIEKIPAKLNKYYMDSDAALMQYLHSMRKAIETRKFFGKIPKRVAKIRTQLNNAEKMVRELNKNMGGALSKRQESKLNKMIAQGDTSKARQTLENIQADSMPDELHNQLRKRRNKYIGLVKQSEAYIAKYAADRDYTANIGAYIDELIINEEIKPGDELVLREIMMARFHEKGASGILRGYKNFSYIDTMGSPLSALTQIGDLAWAMYEGGFIPALKNAYLSVRGKSKITKDDLGLSFIAQEFADNDTLGAAVSKVFKIVGLEKMDTIGKEALMNTALENYQKQATKSPGKLKLKIQKMFGIETDGLIDDLKNGDITENVKLLLFYRALDFQPLTLSEMPQKYLSAGNGRLFYMLKTFTTKQFDVYRNEVFGKIKNGDRAEKIQGLKNLIRLSMFFVMANAGADELKDFVLKRTTDLQDTVIDNILRLFGVSKFNVWTARREGIGSAMIKQILPPFKFADSATRDILSSGDGKGLKTLDSVPVVGKLAYWHFGRGRNSRAELWDDRFKKEKDKYSNFKENIDAAENKGAYRLKHIDEYRGWKRTSKMQGRLNQNRKEINKYKEKPDSSFNTQRIQLLEKQRTEMIKTFLEK